jgi:UDP-N-acetylmuramate dehydrogenase
VKELKLSYNVSLKDYTTYKIGGQALELIIVYSKEELIEALNYAKLNKIRYIIIGKGSNCLFDDRGFNGLVIVNRVSEFSFENGLIEVSGGYSFSLLGIKASRLGYSGLEFASGIPGTVGGAIYMNAGALGRETKDPLLEVEYLDENGSISKIQRVDLEFSYRYSSFQKREGVILSAKFKVQKDEKARERQKSHLDYRMKTQPYKDPSCGSVFRNPDGNYAGLLIEEAGLKGFELGGARVSDLHGNFIINKGFAKAEDVLELIALIKKNVAEKKGILLHTEVKYIPFDE